VADAGELTAFVRAEAQRLGFDLVGVTPAEPLAAAEFHARWVARGFAGDMAWLGRHLEKRADPRQVVPGARSVLCLGMVYDPPAAASGPVSGPVDGPTGRIARYARGDDYHDVLKTRLAELWEALRTRAGAHNEAGRYYVDTGPVLERELAARAGLGWWGKNTVLINRHLGSHLFLAEIITTVELVHDEPATDHCGTCTRCLDACPTDAFPEPYVLDARRCISYLTIEVKGAIPGDLRDGMGDWLLGCDVCQDVCPWNRRGELTKEPAFHARDGLDPVDLLELLAMDREAFNERFRRNPAKRPKRRGLLRNAAVALGNSGDRERGVPALARVLHDEEESLVRSHAAWALGKLGGGAAQRALERARPREADPEVRAEIDAALARLLSES
jgi:epoxyqueuosine reductase